MLKKFTLGILLCLSGLSYGDDTPIIQPWNGEEYHFNSVPQHSAAKDVIENFVFNGTESVLDIGCGDGYTSSLIAEKVPLGCVVGLDLSPTMLEYANKRYQGPDYPNLCFTLGDATKMTYYEEFDWVVSFSTLQLIENKFAVFSGVYDALAPLGIFVTDMPRSIPEALLQATKDIIAKPKWKLYFRDFAIDWHFSSPEGYINQLRLAGLVPFQMIEYTKSNSFPSKKVFVNFLEEWFPHAKRIPEQFRVKFLNEVVERYLVYVPKDENNCPVFHWDRLRIEAVKSLDCPISSP